MKYFHIKQKAIPLYRGVLVMIFTNDKKQLKKHVPDFGGYEIYSHALFRSWHGTQGFIAVFNFNNKSRKIYNGCITHEVIHLVNMIAEERGIISTNDNDEPYAYLGEWITDEIYKAMKKFKLKAST